MSSNTVGVALILTIVSVVGQYKEGDYCTVEQTGDRGVCRMIGDCTDALEAAVYYGIDPQVCSYSGSVAVVCCPPSSPPRNGCLRLPRGYVKVPRTGSKSGDYCINLLDKIYPCQNISSVWTRKDICPPVPDDTEIYHRTYIENVIEFSEFPHLAKLGSGKDIISIDWRCTGTLISERWILTAAWCLDEDYRTVNFVGLFGIYVGSPWNTTPVEICEVSRRVQHPNYNGTISYVYDNIGLLEIDKPPTFSRKVLPACLHSGFDWPSTKLVIVGWDEPGNAFFKWTMNQISHTKCAKKFPAGVGNPFAEGVKDAQHICAKSRAAGACQEYGTGAPLQVYNGDRVACTHLVVGVATFGLDCIVAATRVAPYIPWIESIVWP